MIYEKLLRPVLFRFDPEWIHHQTVNVFAAVSGNNFIRSSLRRHFFVADESLKVKIGLLVFENPVGLSAGFDKYIEAPLAYGMMGFGFAELGSITSGPLAGNPRPRLWRIPEDKGLIIYYGLANCGAEEAEKRSRQLAGRTCPLGLSIAPTTGLAITDMAEDYLKTFLRMNPFYDYVTFNVSCPNVAGCESFAQLSFVKELLVRIKETVEKEKISKDIFIKIGPHFSEGELAEIVAAAIAAGITGIVATNLVKNRNGVVFKSNKKQTDHPGGVSGALLKDASNRTVGSLYKLSQGKLKIIGVGGIFTARDAYEKIRCGASALQMFTGWVYGGPYAVKKINLGLLGLLKKDGFTSISDAVGANWKK